ncbi:MAG: rhodanese-like domain-containing protein [Deltaproteobacteria bacterium]|nr:rhodanese-like domain-containing protein [Deltaproteobacteria bacterium]
MDTRSITMDALPDRLRTAGPHVVLDVRSRLEFARAHVPSALNAPVADVERDPSRVADRLRGCDAVYVHCSKGVRAARAVDALRGAGLRNVVHVRDSGMGDWMRRGLPIERGSGPALATIDPRPWPRALLAGAGAGVVAASLSAVAGVVDGVLTPLVSERHKRRERRVRRGSLHEVGGELLFSRLRGHAPSWIGRVVATAAFSAMYGVVMGTAYTALRRRFPNARTAGGLLATAAALFVACDGAIAPTLRLTPGLTRIPWQLGLRELVNHVVWTATAERLHARDERAFVRGSTS